MLVCQPNCLVVVHVLSLSRVTFQLWFPSMGFRVYQFVSYHICRMVDSFDLYSNRGKHVVMVFDVMSMCLFDLIEFDDDERKLKFL